jgi:hypothetical protein
MEVNMHRDMGMNLLRVWGGGLTERPAFYRAADAAGMLVMQVRVGDSGDQPQRESSLAGIDVLSQQPADYWKLIHIHAHSRV